MTQLADLLELPERIQKSQFVVTLEKGVGDPSSVVNHYAVTEQIHDAYDRALGFVKVAIADHVCRTDCTVSSLSASTDHPAKLTGLPKQPAPR
jgi:hypothetical protein